MTRLSVNLNKVALLRNSRGGTYPDLLEAAALVTAIGAKSITVHPRADARHVTLDDVIALKSWLDTNASHVELNVEADLRQQIVDLVSVVKPTQYTIVPGTAGELTSMRGWRAYDDQGRLAEVIQGLRASCRLSIFCDPACAAVEFLATSGVHAVEFNTRIYAELWAQGRHRDHLAELERAARSARATGLQVHGGHDLTLENLPELIARVKFDELSIGHHLIGRALFEGLGRVVKDHLALLS